MKIGQQISVTITDGRYAGRTLLLDVVEYLPVEPSAYVLEPGWNCTVEIEGESAWFFVSAGGEVYNDGDYYTRQVGICPEQEAEYAKQCATDAEDCYQLDCEAEDARKEGIS
jgi:hypothetical protein